MASGYSEASNVSGKGTKDKIMNILTETAKKEAVNINVAVKDEVLKLLENLINSMIEKLKVLDETVITLVKTQWEIFYNNINIMDDENKLPIFSNLVVDLKEYLSKELEEEMEMEKELIIFEKGMGNIYIIFFLNLLFLIY